MRGRDGWQYVGVALVVLIVAQLAYLALTWDRDDDPVQALDESAATDVSSEAGSDSSESPESDPQSPTAADVPKVPDQRRADFTAGDDLPDGGRLIDIGDNETGMALGEGGLTHGGPGEGGGSGYLETKLKTDVNSLGIRVRFAQDSPGSITVTGWRTSLGEAVADTEPLVQPDSGMRLVASPGEWTLSVVEGEEEVLATGTYDAPAGEAVTFEVVRGEDALYVIDPTGAITQTVSPLVSKLAGPWASWGLIESSAGENPAIIESVWAG